MRAILHALAVAALLAQLQCLGSAFTTGVTTGTLSSSRRFNPSLKLTRIGASPRLNRRARTCMLNSESANAVSEASAPEAIDGDVDTAPIGEADALVSDAPEETATVAAQTDTVRIEQSGEDDIIRRFVKRREDWWEAGVASPFAGLGEDDDLINQLIEKLPLPSYFFLLTSTVLAIAFVGCIFQLFYNQPPAPVLGVPITALILVSSGPTFATLFLAAIRKGQKEAEEDDLLNM